MIENLYGMKHSFRKASVILVCAMCLMHAPATAAAQTYENIGFNSVSGEQLECIQFAESKLNTILVTKVNSGKQIVLSPKQAIRKMKRKIVSLAQQRKSLNRLSKRLKKKRARLAKKIGASAEKLSQLKDKIAKFDIRLARNSNDRELLKFLLNQIKECSEDAKIIGDFRVFNQVYTLGNSLRFAAGLYYSVKSKKDLRGLKTKISGLSQRIPGALTAPFPEAPQFSYLTVRKDFCLTQIVEEGCVKELPGTLALLVFIGGAQAPDTCGTATSYRCSVSETVNLLQSLASNASVKVVSKIK